MTAHTTVSGYPRPGDGGETRPGPSKHRAAAACTVGDRPPRTELTT